MKPGMKLNKKLVAIIGGIVAVVIIVIIVLVLALSGGKGQRSATKIGDELAKTVVDEQAHILGRTLAQIACVVDPEIFVIGGGVSKAGSILTDAVKEYFVKYAFHACRGTKFALAELGNDAGIYGAARSILK